MAMDGIFVGMVLWVAIVWTVASGVIRSFIHGRSINKVALLNYGTRTNGPHMICQRCGSRAIPRVDLQTKGAGYCNYCGSIIWEKMIIKLSIKKDICYCPHCKNYYIGRVIMRNYAQNAFYCPMCGLAIQESQNMIFDVIIQPQKYLYKGIKGENQRSTISKVAFWG
jgi:hypothetical protein